MKRIFLSNNDIRRNVMTWLWLNDTDYLFVPQSEPHDFQIGWTDRPKIPKLSPKLFQTKENLFDDKQYLSHIEDPTYHILTNCIEDDFYHPRVHFNDLIFNRTKAYYENKKIKFGVSRWYHISDECYKDINLGDGSQKNKLFVAPCWVPDTHIELIVSRPQRYRRMFNQWIKSYKSLGWFSDPLLPTNFEYPDITDPNKIPGSAYTKKSMSLDRDWIDYHGYSPPHDCFYRDTFISIFVESFEFGKTKVLTEKTFDPLIKGHFVLPFASPGHIDLIRKRGIKLPDFIDYSYDKIVPTQKRFDAWTDEIKRILDIPLDQWQQYWKDNLDILQHNKDWFYKQPYDIFDLSILTST